MTETFDGGSGERELWPAPDNPRPVARRIADMAKAKGQPLCYWNEMWFFWNGTHYQQITVETIRDNLYEILGDAKYIGAQDTELNWKPTPGKLNGVIDAARGLVKLPGGVRAAMWLDGRDELVSLVRMDFCMLALETCCCTRPTTSTSCLCLTTTTPARSARDGCDSWRKYSAMTRNLWRCYSSGLGTCFRVGLIYRRCS